MNKKSNKTSNHIIKANKNGWGKPEFFTFHSKHYSYLHSSFPITVSIFSSFKAGSIVVWVAWPMASYILWSLTSNLSNAIFYRENTNKYPCACARIPYKWFQQSLEMFLYYSRWFDFINCQNTMMAVCIKYTLHYQ